MEKVDVSFVGTNLHSFKKFFIDNYSLDDSDINIKNVVLEYCIENKTNKPTRQKKNIETLKNEYSQVIFITDFEAHHFSNPEYEDFKFMLNMQTRLLDEYDDGLLLIDYPMHEAYRDFKNYNLDSILELKVNFNDSKNYKSILHERALIKNLKNFDAPNLKKIFLNHFEKFKVICKIPMQNPDYILNDYLLYLLEKQINDYVTNDEFHVISTSSLWYLSQITDNY